MGSSSFLSDARTAGLVESVLGSLAGLAGGLRAWRPREAARRTKLAMARESSNKVLKGCQRKIQRKLHITISYDGFPYGFTAFQGLILFEGKGIAKY